VPETAISRGLKPRVRTNETVGTSWALAPVCSIRVKLTARPEIGFNNSNRDGGGSEWRLFHHFRTWSKLVHGAFAPHRPVGTCG
jgi:hypothetical protein